MQKKVVSLDFVNNRDEILRSFAIFNSEARKNYQLAKSLCRTTSYWAYDSKTNAFGPSKFVGFKNMNFEDYELDRRGFSNGKPFNGYNTRKAIEVIIEDYKPNIELSDKLVKWGEKLLKSGLFDGINENKWKFVSL